MCDGEHAGELGLVDGEVRGQRSRQLLVLGPELLHQSEISIVVTTTNQRTVLRSRQPIRDVYSHLVLQSLAGGDGLHGSHGAGGCNQDHYHYSFHS